MARAQRIGLISDTHGLLRPQALDALRGSDHIVHAGDIGKAEILRALADIAPVVAVRGNNDNGDWADSLADTATLRVGVVDILVIHDAAHLRHQRAHAAVQVVVAGHSHKPLVQRRDGVLFVNPGSAGPRRFKLPVSVGRLIVTDAQVEAQLIEIAT